MVARYFLVAMENSCRRSLNQRIEQAAEGSRQQHCWTAGPRKRPHDNWRCGNLADALHESTIGTGCGVSGERSPERFLTFDASNERVQKSFGGRGIAVRFPQREVAETCAPNVEVEVVMAGSLFQYAFCTELSIFELARLLCYLQQVYAVSVRLRLLSLGPVPVQMPVQGHCIQRHWATPSPTSQDERSASLEPFRAQERECANVKWLGD